MQTKEYQWKIFSDKQLKLWPQNNIPTYLNFAEESFFHKSLDWGGQDVKFPAAYTNKIWEKFAILSLGHVCHTKGFYHSRQQNPYIDIIFVVRGKFGVKFGKTKLALTRGQMLVIAPNCACDTFVNCKNALVYWAHLKPAKQWSNILKKEPFTVALNCLNQLINVLIGYELELFSQTPSPFVLEQFAGIFAHVLKRQLCNKQNPLPEQNSALLRPYAESVAQNPKDALSPKNCAQKFGITQRQLDDFFYGNFSLSYSKYVLAKKMAKALEYLKTPLTNAQIAENLGYANAYSFSKAFRIFYKKSPKFAKNQL